MPISIDRAADLRQKAVTEGLSKEEMKEVVQYLRKDRVSACFASKTSRKQKKTVAKEKVDNLTMDLLADFPGESESPSSDTTEDIPHDDFSI